MLSECGPLLPARVEAPLRLRRLSNRGPSTRALAQDDSAGEHNFWRVPRLLGILLLLALPVLAQVSIGDSINLNLSGDLNSGYTGSFGSTGGSSHGLGIGGDGYLFGFSL